MEELDGSLLGVVVSLVALVSFLARQLISNLKRQIRELKQENRQLAEALAQMEEDLNEAWVQVRKLTGKRGGKRARRYTIKWRLPDATVRTSTPLRKVSDKP